MAAISVLDIRADAASLRFRVAAAHPHLGTRSATPQDVAYVRSPRR